MYASGFGQDGNGLVTTSKKFGQFFQVILCCQIKKVIVCFLFDRISLIICFFHLLQEVTKDILFCFSPFNRKCGTHRDVAPTFHQINLIN